MRLTELDISAATFACLEAVGIRSIEQFGMYPGDELLAQPHVGAWEFYEVVHELSQHGLGLPSIPGGKIRVAEKPRPELVRLRVIDGLTFAEIGEHVGLSTERVRQLLHDNYGVRRQPSAVGARRRRETIERIWTS